MNSNHKLLYYNLLGLEIQYVNYKFYPFLQTDLLYKM